MNSLTSPTILSATPSSRTTELRGLRLRGKPKGLHSDPRAVYMTVRPSSCFSASSLAAGHRSEPSLDTEPARVQLVLVCVLVLTFLQDVKENLPVSA